MSAAPPSLLLVYPPHLMVTSARLCGVIWQLGTHGLLPSGSAEASATAESRNGFRFSTRLTLPHRDGGVAKSRLGSKWPES